MRTHTWWLAAGLLLGGADQVKAQAPVPAMRIGTHNLTLQWISWDRPGKVQIGKLTDSTFTIKGEQRAMGKEGEDFVTIDGKLTLVNPRELVFTGTIKSRVSYIYGGEVCDRTGTYHFLSKDKRKYWRLQEMANCEGADKAVDYVDIYF